MIKRICDHCTSEEDNSIHIERFYIFGMKIDLCQHCQKSLETYVKAYTGKLDYHAG